MMTSKGGSAVLLFIFVALIAHVICDLDERCQQTVDQGNCADYVERWFFNSEVQACLRFKFTGCGGNGNNFVNEEECRSTCMSNSQTEAHNVTTAQSNEVDKQEANNATNEQINQSAAGPSVTVSLDIKLDSTSISTNDTANQNMITNDTSTATIPSSSINPFATNDDEDEDEEEDENKANDAIVAQRPDGDDDLDEDAFVSTANVLRLKPELQGKLNVNDMEVLEEVMSQSDSFLSNDTDTEEISKTVSNNRTVGSGVKANKSQNATVERELNSQPTPIVSQQIKQAQQSVTSEQTPTVTKPTADPVASTTIKMTNAQQSSADNQDNKPEILPDNTLQASISLIMQKQADLAESQAYEANNEIKQYLAASVSADAENTTNLSPSVEAQHALKPNQQPTAGQPNADQKNQPDAAAPKNSEINTNKQQTSDNDSDNSDSEDDNDDVQMTTFGEEMMKEIKKEGSFNTKFMNPIENAYLQEIVSQFDTYRMSPRLVSDNIGQSAKKVVGLDAAQNMKQNPTVESQIRIDIKTEEQNLPTLSLREGQHESNREAAVTLPAEKTTASENSMQETNNAVSNANDKIDGDKAKEDEDNDDDEEGDEIETYIDEACKKGYLDSTKLSAEEKEILNSFGTQTQFFVLQKSNVANQLPSTAVKGAAKSLDAAHRKPIPKIGPDTDGKKKGGAPLRCQLRPDTGPCKAGTGMWYYDVSQGKCNQFVYGGCLGNANRFATLKDCAAVCVGQIQQQQIPVNNEDKEKDIEADIFPLREGPNDRLYGENTNAAKPNENRPASVFFENLFTAEKSAPVDDNTIRRPSAPIMSNVKIPMTSEQQQNSGQRSNPIFLKMNMPTRISIQQPQMAPIMPQQFMVPQRSEPARYFAPSISKDFHFEKALTDNRRQTFASPNTRFNLFQVFIDQKEAKQNDQMPTGRELDSSFPSKLTTKSEPLSRNLPPRSGKIPIPLPPPQLPQPAKKVRPARVQSTAVSTPVMYQSRVPFPILMSFPPPPPMPFFLPPPMAFVNNRMMPPMAYTRAPVKRLLLKPVRPVFKISKSKSRSHSRSRSKPAPKEIKYDRQQKNMPEICQLPVASGICRPSVVRWYYNNKLRQCERFYFGGCQGNANRFETAEECQRTCLDTDVKVTTEYPRDVIVVTQPVYVPAGIAAQETAAMPEVKQAQQPLPEKKAEVVKVEEKKEEAVTVTSEFTTTKEAAKANDESEITNSDEHNRYAAPTGVVEIRQGVIVILVMCIVAMAVIILVTISIARFCLKRKATKKEATVEELVKNHLQTTMPVVFVPQSTENIYGTMKSTQSISEEAEKSHL